jgi:two-component system chemotaxis response regulator CheB
MNIKQIIVIGASAGGLQAVSRLIKNLPPDLPIVLFVVIHLSKRSSAEIISRHLQKNTTSYTCVVANDREEFKVGHLYVAPPEHHLFIKEGYIRLTNGPHENRWRPAIDVLFRSAAAAYDSLVTGIILTGMMDDGTSGLVAIKRSGGTCIVQEPEEAEYMDMPVSALSNVDVDHRLLLADIGNVIMENLKNPKQPVQQIPEDIKIEASITERMTSSIEDMEKIATHSNYTCPDCGGGLWAMKNEKLSRYRCHTGHVYTEKVLLEKQSEEMEESLWVCTRMMEERRNILQTMAWRDKEQGLSTRYELYQKRADDLNGHIGRLKELLVSVSHAEPDSDGYL